MRAICIGEMYHPIGKEMLQQHIPVDIVDGDATEAIIESVKDAVAILVRTPYKVTSEMIVSAPILKIICTSGYGYDNVDVATATRCGVVVCNQVGFGQVAVAEHSVSMLFAMAKYTVNGHLGVLDGTGWAQRTRWPGVNLRGRSIAVIGIGSIGSEVARICSFGLGMDVRGYDPYITKSPPFAHLTTNLDDALRDSFALTLHLPLTDQTTGIIGDKELSLLSDGAFLINTSRFGVVERAALLAHASRLGGVGLDVYPEEPISTDDALLSMPRVLLSPHVAGVTQDAIQKIAASGAQQVLDILDGKQPTGVVNQDAWNQHHSLRN